MVMNVIYRVSLYVHVFHENVLAQPKTSDAKQTNKNINIEIKTVLVLRFNIHNIADLIGFVQPF